MKITPIDDGQDVYLAPDLVMAADGLTADFAIAPRGTSQNSGGLKASNGIVTAVIMCLFTDRAADPSELPDGVENRGWPGDAISLTPGKPAKPLGSKLWLLRRRALTDGILRQAEVWAVEAMQTLIDQGAAVQATASATRNGARRLDLDVALYGRDGSRVYAGKFGLLWEQVIA